MMILVGMLLIVLAALLLASICTAIVWAWRKWR